MDTPRRDRPHEDLFLLDADGHRTGCVGFDGGQLLVGRAPNSDVVLDLPDVSRRHAALYASAGGVYVRDLGSTAGTRVNGIPISAPRLLHPGDVVACASGSFEYGGRDAGFPPPPTHPAAGGAPTRTDARFDVAAQRAGTISNVAGNQHNTFTTQVLQDRESILRDIATTRSRARWIIIIGFALFIVGFSIFAAGILRFIIAINTSLSADGPPAMLTPFGAELFGVPSGVLGWAAAALGAILMVVGTVLHAVVSAKRKQLDHDLPLPGRQRHAGRAT